MSRVSLSLYYVSAIFLSLTYSHILLPSLFSFFLSLSLFFFLSVLWMYCYVTTTQPKIFAFLKSTIIKYSFHPQNLNLQLRFVIIIIQFFYLCHLLYYSPYFKFKILSSRQEDFLLTESCVKVHSSSLVLNILLNECSHDKK